MTTSSSTPTPDLTGQKVIVTGANSGIGRAAASALAGYGAHVVLAVRNIEKGQAAAAVPHLQKATGDADAGVRDEAREMLRRLGK